MLGADPTGSCSRTIESQGRIVQMLVLRYLQPLRNFLRVFSAERSPRQIAGAVALGLSIGLLPKGSLLVAVVTCVLFSLRVNLGIGLLVAFCVSWLSPYLAPLNHGIGVRLFEIPTVYHTVQDLYDWPLVPWTSLNNTVVLGSVCLAVLLFFPAFHLTESALSRLQSLASNWRAKRREPVTEWRNV